MLIASDTRMATRMGRVENDKLFREIEELDALKRCVEYIHQDLCDREDVGD